MKGRTEHSLQLFIVANSQVVCCRETALEVTVNDRIAGDLNEICKLEASSRLSALQMLGLLHFLYYSFYPVHVEKPDKWMGFLKNIGGRVVAHQSV